MRPKMILVGLSLTVLAVSRVGVLGNNPVVPALYEMFKEGLGYPEGQQVVFIERDADNVPSRLPSTAAALVQARPSEIFARGPAAVAAATRATTTIPIVAVDLESDPLALGYAKTLARPGSNVTGVFLASAVCGTVCAAIFVPSAATTPHHMGLIRPVHCEVVAHDTNQRKSSLLLRADLVIQ